MRHVGILILSSLVWVGGAIHQNATVIFAPEGPSPIFNDVVERMLHAHRIRFGGLSLVAGPGPWRWTTAALMLVGLKVACVVVNVLGQLSPMGSVLKMRNNKSTAAYDALPFFMVFFCGSLWVSYASYTYFVLGIHGGLVIMVPNLAGLVLGLAYTVIYHQNCKEESRLRNLKCYYVVGFAVWCFELAAAESMVPVRAAFAMGLTAAGFSIISSASTMATLPIVLKTKSCESIPVPMVIMGFLGNLLWAICGIILKEIWVSLPAVLGLVLSTFQLGLVLVFREPPELSKALRNEMYGALEDGRKHAL